jgi:hypothetical protein
LAVSGEKMCQSLPFRAAPAVFTLDTAAVQGQSASGNMASGADNVSVNLRSRSAPGTIIAKESFMRFWTLLSFNATDMTPKFKTGDLA